MGAQAFTQGENIHFAPGQYAPHSNTGMELIGHELAHVVQQREGRVAATAQAKGAAINADPRLEAEADDLGARAARGEVVRDNTPATLAAAVAPIQGAKLGTGGATYSADEYVKWYFYGSEGKEMLAAEAEKRRGNSTKRNQTTAVDAIIDQIAVDADKAGQKEAALKRANVIDAEDVEDIKALVMTKLIEAQPGEEGHDVAPKRRPIASGTWKHIWRGDYNKGKNKPTGYHWKGKGTDAWLQGDGQVGAAADGFYEEGVVIRDGKTDSIKAETKATGSLTAEKTGGSTFFPDNWSEGDVKDAIETRDGQGKITSKDVPGVTLVKSGGTIYPSID